MYFQQREWNGCLKIKPVISKNDLAERSGGMGLQIHWANYSITIFFRKTVEQIKKFVRMRFCVNIHRQRLNYRIN